MRASVVDKQVKLSSKTLEPVDGCRNFSLIWDNVNVMMLLEETEHMAVAFED